MAKVFLSLAGTLLDLQVINDYILFSVNSYSNSLNLSKALTRRAKFLNIPVFYSFSLYLWTAVESGVRFNMESF